MNQNFPFLKMPDFTLNETNEMCVEKILKLQKLCKNIKDFDDSNHSNYTITEFLMCFNNIFKHIAISENEYIHLLLNKLTPPIKCTILRLNTNAAIDIVKLLFNLYGNSRIELNEVIDIVPNNYATFQGFLETFMIKACFFSPNTASLLFSKAFLTILNESLKIKYEDFLYEFEAQYQCQPSIPKIILLYVSRHRKSIDEIFFQNNVAFKDYEKVLLCKTCMKTNHIAKFCFANIKNRQQQRAKIKQKRNVLKSIL